MNIWDEIYIWLEKSAPKIKNALQPPASADDLNKVEAIIGQELPESIKSLYLKHDGLSLDVNANFFFGMTFIPLSRVIMHLEEISKRDSDFDLQHADAGIDPGYRLSKTRIPIADDFGTSLLCVDLEPSEGGCKGQVIFIDYKMDTGLFIASSVEDLLSKFASDLNAGKYQLSPEARADGVDWLDPERSIDPVNWYNSPTWSYVSS